MNMIFSASNQCTFCPTFNSCMINMCISSNPCRFGHSLETQMLNQPDKASLSSISYLPHRGGGLRSLSFSPPPLRLLYKAVRIPHGLYSAYLVEVSNRSCGRRFNFMKRIIQSESVNHDITLRRRKG